MDFRLSKYEQSRIWPDLKTYLAGAGPRHNILQCRASEILGPKLETPSQIEYFVTYGHTNDTIIKFMKPF